MGPLPRVRRTRRRRDSTGATRAARPEVRPKPKRCRSAPPRSGRRALDAQRAPRGLYLRVRHQIDEQAHERESVRANRTAQQRRTRACQILPPPRSLAPLDLRNGRPLGQLKTTVFPLCSPRSSDPVPRRGLALAGVPAANDAPSARARARSIDPDRCPLYAGKTQKGRAAQPRRGVVGALRAASTSFVRTRGRDADST